jgi:hypothetical protein
MSIDINLDVWEAMQEHIVDIKSAADDFVAVLIENGIEAQKIADVTTNEDVRKALLDYDVEVEIEEDDEFEYFEEDD